MLSSLLVLSLINIWAIVDGKYINGYTLRSMGLIKTVDKLETDLKESMIVSNLMADEQNRKCTVLPK